MNLRTAKLMGGIGAILGICLIIPYVGWLLSLTGLVLVLIALKNISDTVNESKIFTHYLVSFLLSIVNMIVLVVGIVVTIFSSFRQNGLWFWQQLSSAYNNWNWNQFGNTMNQYFDNLYWPQFVTTLLVGIIIVIVISWVISIVSAYFVKSSFDLLSKKTGEKNFSISGLLIFIGAIIPILGIVVTFVGNIFKIIAFFSLPDTIKEPENT
jgi:uncharacterized membrane protein